ncbi:hypothetical protein SHI21_02520 [Bacteriovorax sp. PP10]|uniref:Uncharacterized protein n=1 Tax=Bacteriovorax antarcticus TaxID=3088717 RepID=A0ABU5VPU4_9BACT|nr:hypothetical protein [Bacteriovorax sp. PP10]MEA9355054.1 hypothetical protein [Bacteriovorax sp. PP10]
MKLLAYFLACLLILSNTTDAEAAATAGKELYSSVEEDIASYYQAGGEWELTKIDRMEFVHSESAEYILVSAKTRIRNVNNGKKTKENCLLSYVQDGNEFHSINCF